MQASSKIAVQMEQAYRLARSLGFPAFPEGVQASTPINATPFLIDIDGLVLLSQDPWRIELIQRLLSLIDETRGLGVSPLAALIGGSFLDSSCVPHDLDCVIFYENGQRSSHELARLQKKWRTDCIDVRFIPYDRDPIILLKAAVYFGALYSSTRSGNSRSKAALLLDVREQGQ